MGNKVDITRIVGIILIIVVTIFVVLLLALYCKENNLFSSAEVASADEEFNTMWKKYSGSKIGEQVNSMLIFLEKNARDNIKDASKLIDIAYQSTPESEFNIVTSTVAEPNSFKIKDIRNDINPKKDYNVELIYSKKTGNVSGIIIKANFKANFKFTPDET